MPEPTASGISDEAIHALIARLARPRAAGGYVIERAAILAAGPDSAAIEAWILAHDGEPEPDRAKVGTSSVAREVRGMQGLHSGRSEGLGRGDRAPRRFVLPRGALRPDRSAAPDPHPTEELPDARQAPSDEHAATG